MKKMLILLFCLTIPLFLLADSIFPGFGHFMQNLERGGRLRSYTTETWTMENVWSPEMHYDYYYNNLYTTQLDSVISGTSNGMGGWQPNSKMTFTYDSSHQYITHVYAYNINQPNVVQAEAFVQYDGEHKLTQIHTLSYGTSGVNFAQRYYFTYTGSQLTEMLNSLSSPMFSSYTKELFTADAQGRIASRLEMTSSDSLAWGNNYKTDYTYHPSDNTTSASFNMNLAKYFFLNMISNQDIMYGKVATEVEKTWLQNNWVDHYRLTYTYDNSGWLTDILGEYGNSAPGVWVADYRWLYVYDAAHNPTSITRQQFNTGTSGWVDYNRELYTWDNTSANDTHVASPVADLSIRISPNPFRGQVSFTILSKAKYPVQLSVYNMKGQLVHQNTALPNVSTSWDGNNLQGKKTASGVYFVRITQHGVTTTSKMLHLQ